MFGSLWGLGFLGSCCVLGGLFVLHVFLFVLGGCCLYAWVVVLLFVLVGWSLFVMSLTLWLFVAVLVGVLFSGWGFVVGVIVLLDCFIVVFLCWFVGFGLVC